MSSKPISMRNVVLFIASSLDGYIASPDGSIDWLFTDADYGYEEFYASIDTVLMGRKTYDQTLTFESYPFIGKRCIVFTTRNDQPTLPEVEFVRGDPAALIQTLKTEPGKDIFLVGGKGLLDRIVEENLIDIYCISIHPLILGAGIPLFGKFDHRTGLRLVRTLSFPSGLVQLWYEKLIPENE